MNQDEDDLTEEDINNILQSLKDAREYHIKMGHDIVYVKDNKLVRRKGDGTIEFIKDMPPRINVKEYLEKRNAEQIDKT